MTIEQNRKEIPSDIPPYKKDKEGYYFETELGKFRPVDVFWGRLTALGFDHLTPYEEMKPYRQYDIDVPFGKQRAGRPRTIGLEGYHRVKYRPRKTGT